MKTREAYNVIVKRIEAKTRVFKKRICMLLLFFGNFLLFYAIIFFAGAGLVDNAMTFIALLIVIGIVAFLVVMQKLFVTRASMKEGEEIKEVAILRRNAAGPSSALKLPDWLQERQNKRSGSNTFNDSPAYYGGGAACGVSPYTYTGGGATGGEGGNDEW